MHKVYIGLGANLDNPERQLKTVLQTLQNQQEIQLAKVSSFYGSKPLGPQDQPDYINAVALLETELTPHQLLAALQQIEIQQGRVKKRHWGERVIDLDILLYDDLQLVSVDLQIPHLQMHLRDFVLLPLAEIAPHISIPGLGKVEELISHLDESFLKAL